MAAAPVYFGTIANDVAQLVNADGADTYKTLYTAPANGGVVESIAVTSTDTSARDVSMSVQKGGVDYPVVTKTIPVNAGSIAATPAVDLLNATDAPWLRVDANGNRVMYLETGSVLRVKVLTAAVTAAKAISFVVQSREV
jgi:hypothetical protein